MGHQDILVGPWFATENGRPSITALIGKIMLGDYVLVPDNEEIWAEDFTPHICAKKGWIMEMMSATLYGTHSTGAWPVIFDTMAS
jgi:proteasome assembly chaperone (PAC2) family protein